jgi:hypothetical protein
MGPGPRDKKTSRKEPANLGASLPRPTQASDSESKFKLPGGAKARRMPLQVGTLEVPCEAAPLQGPGPWPGGLVLLLALWADSSSQAGLGRGATTGSNAAPGGGYRAWLHGARALGSEAPQGATIPGPRPLRFL